MNERFESSGTLQSIDSSQSVFPQVKLAVVAIAIAVINFCGVIGSNELDHRSFDLFFSFGMGCLAAEVSMIAIVIGLIRAGGLSRIIAVVVAGSFWILGYLLGLKVIDDRIPLEIVVTVAVASVASILLFQIPILLYRVATGSCLVHASNGKKSYSQFQIRHLLIVTALVAMLIAGAQLTVHNSHFRASGVPWWSVTGFLLTFIGIAATVMVPSLMIVFDRSRRAPAMIFSVANMLLGAPFLAFVGFSMASSRQGIIWDSEEFFGETYGYILLFFMGNIATTLFLLLLIRILGFHLASEE